MIKVTESNKMVYYILSIPVESNIKVYDDYLDESDFSYDIEEETSNMIADIRDRIEDRIKSNESQILKDIGVSKFNLEYDEYASFDEPTGDGNNMIYYIDIDRKVDDDIILNAVSKYFKETERSEIEVDISNPDDFHRKYVNIEINLKTNEPKLEFSDFL